MGTLLSLKKYFLRYKNKLLWGFVFIIFSDITMVYVPILLKNSIDALQKNIDYSTLFYYASLIVITSLVSGIFRFFIRQTIIVVSREIEYDMRQDFWEHIQLLPMRYFQNTSTGNIMAHATNDINAVRMFVGPAVMYSTDTGIRLIMVIILMLGLSVKLTLYSFIPLPFLSYLVYKIGKKIHLKYTAIQAKFADLTTKAQENFSGIRVIKSYIREENEIKEFRTESNDLLKKNMEMIKLQSFFFPVLFLITGLSIIIVVWLGGIEVIKGNLSLGDISAFVIFLGMLIWPMIAVGWVTNIIQQAAASMKRLNNILSQKYEIEDSLEAETDVKNLKGDIEFRNVSFRYSENLPYVIRNVNLKIPAGYTAAIVGHTGVGKTSLINLIPRLFDVTEGEVLINNLDIRKIPLKVLRKNIGLVPQETFLFSDTLANNIAYGLSVDENTKMELVSKAAEISQMKKDVETFPLGYDTILGERGITLSGGQKQRTSLARALAIDPDILILDDSFSSVDTRTEEEILISLKEFMKDLPTGQAGLPTGRAGLPNGQVGRTSIIISHRISTVKDADIIFVIDDGQIAEEGTHEELILKQGIYADMHYKQLLEKELEELN